MAPEFTPKQGEGESHQIAKSQNVQTDWPLNN
jgi:hypothetical protein